MVLHFLSLTSMYVQSLISIPFALKWLRGDTSINIQGMIMVLVQCPSHIVIYLLNQVSFQFL